jgi:hypothetical protein
MSTSALVKKKLRVRNFFIRFDPSYFNLSFVPAIPSTEQDCLTLP